MSRILLLSRTFPPHDRGAQRRYANLCRSFLAGSIEVCTSRREGAEFFDRRQSYPIHRMPVEPNAERRPAGFARWMAWTLRGLRHGDKASLFHRPATAVVGRDRADRELDHERAAREIHFVSAECSWLPLPAWVPRAGVRARAETDRFAAMGLTAPD
jgi:hypothetical protein